MVYKVASVPTEEVLYDTKAEKRLDAVVVTSNGCVDAFGVRNGDEEGIFSSGVRFQLPNVTRTYSQYKRNGYGSEPNTKMCSKESFQWCKTWSTFWRGSFRYEQQ